MEAPTLSFRDTVQTRFACLTTDCNSCPIQNNCNEHNLQDNLTWWLEYILDKLDNSGCEIEELTEEEWAAILEGDNAYVDK